MSLQATQLRRSSRARSAASSAVTTGPLASHSSAVPSATVRAQPLASTSAGPQRQAAEADPTAVVTAVASTAHRRPTRTDNGVATPPPSTPALKPTKRKATPKGAAQKKPKKNANSHITTSNTSQSTPPATDDPVDQPVAVDRSTTAPFSFEAFTRDFHAAPSATSSLMPPPSTPPAPVAAPPDAALASEVSTLRQQVETLTSLLSTMVDQRLNAAPLLPERLPAVQLVRPTATFFTEPNASGELPPEPLRQLGIARFESMPYKIKNGHNPPPAEMLASHRLYHGLHIPSGKMISPTSFVSTLRDSEAVLFAITSATITAILCGKIGSRGLSAVCYRELSPSERMRNSSSRTNLFDLNKIIAPNVTTSPTFDDLIKAMKALRRFARAHWFEHGQWLMTRLSDFVDDVSRTNSISPQRVMTATSYVDRSLGRALSTLELDDPSWWHKYCENVRRIDARGNEWTQLLLDDLASTAAPHPPAQFRNPLPAQLPHSANFPRGGRYGPRPQDNHGGMPAHIKALIPKEKVNHVDIEPCLRHYSGRGCPGGPDKCDKSFRTHDWKGELPAQLLAYIRRPWTHRDKE